MGCQRVDCGMEMAQFGCAVGRLRRAHAQEVGCSEFRHLGEGGGEPQPAGLEVLPEQRFETRLEERHLATGNPRELVRVHVQAHHVMAEIGHADRVTEAQVAGADHGQPHRRELGLVALLPCGRRLARARRATDRCLEARSEEPGAHCGSPPRTAAPMVLASGTGRRRHTSVVHCHR